MRFGPGKRLSHARQFQAVYAARTSVVRGPLRIHALPNATGVTRLGLSVPGRVGTNVKRNAIKRLIREAFRLSQHEMPKGLDVVVAVHPHEVAELAAYQRAVVAATTELAQTWEARARKESARGAKRVEGGDV